MAIHLHLNLVTQVLLDVLMKQFWQIPLYELTTRALIHADQNRIRLWGKKNPPKNDGGTLDLNFGPQRSAASPELSWVQTN